jgi:GR25 family glycosyltransferase involved in LPS biosynthesis
MERQFEILRPGVPVHYLEASTPANSADYLPDDSFKLQSPEHRLSICCGRSHIRAMEYASRPGMPPFSVILEDDAAMHKTQFFNTVKEVIAKWDTEIVPARSKLVALGWLCGKQHTKFDSELSCRPGSGLLHNYFAYGLQAYMVRREDMWKYIINFDFPTYVQLREHIHSLRVPDLNPEDPIVDIDYYLTHTLGETLVYPPVAIETGGKSTLNHNDHSGYWDQLFKGREEMRNDYLTRERLPPDFQCIVITCNAERRKHMEAQFAALRPGVPIHFLEASTPANSADYLPKEPFAEKDAEKRLALCCARSHIRAMEFAGRPESPPFSVILEDDVALHKTQFFNTVKEVITLWSTRVAPRKNRYVSLGWIPSSPFEEYVKRPSVCELKCVFGSSLQDGAYIVGMQAYLVRREDMWNYGINFEFPTYLQLRDHVRRLRVVDMKEDDEVIHIDHYLPRMLGQSVVFPPVAIETNVSSSLGHSNYIYWHHYFKDREAMKDDFLDRCPTPPTTPPPFQCIVITCNAERRAFMEAQFAALQPGVPVHFLEASTLANSAEYLPKEPFADKDITKRLRLCCARSHIRAMEFAGRPESPPFSVILEDDAALHKTQFFNTVKEVIALWDTHVAARKNKYVSLGWMPARFHEYIHRPILTELVSRYGSRLLEGLYSVGLQAYLVRREDMWNYGINFEFPTYLQLRDHVRRLRVRDMAEDDEVIDIDQYLPRMLGQSVVFPPVAIETGAKTTLHHIGNGILWDNYFKDREAMRDDYSTY